jgi:hypothetical protein
MTVQCIACSAFRFERGTDKEPTKDAKNGGGRCAFRGPEFLASALCKRECDKYTAHDMKQVIRLRAWLANQPGGK